jgi:hypothetical protein
MYDAALMTPLKVFGNIRSIANAMASGTPVEY